MMTIFIDKLMILVKFFYVYINGEKKLKIINLSFIILYNKNTNVADLTDI